jgi:hypothetical protein
MKHSAGVGAAAAVAPRQRPREAQEAITGDDLPLVSYEQYYECGWPSIVRTTTVEYKFEVLTKGLGPDWARGGSGGAFGDSNDLAALMQEEEEPGDDGEQTQTNLLESLNTYVPAQAQSILGVEECLVQADATQRVFDGTSGGLRHRQRALALQGEGIVQIIPRSSRYDDNAGECDSDGNGNGDGDDGVVCTPLKSYSTIVFDPEVTDERHASQVVMTAITEAVSTVTSPTNDESRLQGDIDTSIFANNVVGIQVTEWNEDIAVKSDIIVPTDDEIYNTDVVTSRKEGGKDVLASGAVAGIVITVLLALAAVVAMLVVRKRRRSAAAHSPRSDDSMGDNTTYNEKAYDLSLYEHPNNTGLSTFEENEKIGNVDPVESTAAGLANVAADVADTALEQNDTTCCSFGAGGATDVGMCQR